MTKKYSSLHVIGIYFFTKGFLLTRLVLDDRSECETPLVQVPDHVLQSEAGCWHPKTFDKAIIIIIDALRYDFTVPFKGEARHYHNALTILHETASQNPREAFLLPFIADPPTTTLQRLKGLTTGTLPTFIDAGSNFAGTAIEEDNLLMQLRVAGKRLVHLGDDTWHSLFPGYFDQNLTHSYDSFNVWDLHTVDNGVNEHIFPLMDPDHRNNWDVIFGHYLGVDHAGHRYGPDHPATNAKLKQMDTVIRDLIRALDDQTLLVIMGDHGMDIKGDHGGESDDEVEAALWMFSKKGAFGRLDEASFSPPLTAKERPVAQIDLVPTLALLLGLPIPFNNLGTPISEAFAKGLKPDYKSLATVNALSAAQVENYRSQYSDARGLSPGTFASASTMRQDMLKAWQEASSSEKELPFAQAYKSATEYQREVLRVCRSLWARFDVSSMVIGIAILASSTSILLISSRSSNIWTDSGGLTLESIYSFGFLGACASMLLSQKDTVDLVNGALLGYSAGSVLGVTVRLLRDNTKSFRTPPFVTFWDWLSLVMMLAPAAGFASNSYTIWEDEILLYLLSTFGFATFIASFRQTTTIDCVLGCTQSALFIGSTRLASLSRLCREEQMPYCRSSYYASTTSSTSSPWQLTIPLVVAINLPLIIGSYYKATQSYNDSAVSWLGSGFRLSLVGVAIFWLLDAADDGEWFTNVSKSSLKLTRSVLARVLFGTVLGLGNIIYYYAGPCLRIQVPAAENGIAGEGAAQKPKQLRVFGYGNMHGSRYFLLVSNFIVAIALVQKPMGIGAIGIMATQVLALLEILNANKLSSSSVGPVVLGLLGSFHFFKTGHQATLASIQWESAFVPLATITYPWSPLLVILNTFGAQILSILSVPLLALWRKPPTQKGLLADIARHLATTILYYAVINLATTMWAGHLRRHLMLYRVFSPRFMMGAISLIVVDIMGIFVALGAVRLNFIRVAEAFGWG